MLAGVPSILRGTRPSTKLQMPKIFLKKRVPQFSWSPALLSVDDQARAPPRVVIPSLMAHEAGHAAIDH